MIMPFFGGVFIDRIGMRAGIFLFSSLLLIGQVIQAVAGYYGSYDFFLVGRTIFGLGGENMCITMSKFFFLSNCLPLNIYF
jgi:MFS family permease